MATGSFVAYYRVSTAKQGRSGLGLEAQREAVRSFLNGGDWRLLAEFTEVESGKRSDRAELAKALQACRVYGARLVIAKLDRLSRDAHFLLGLQKAGVPFVAADMPEANEMVVGIMAVVAQAERKMISARTKSALAAAKARGVKLGGHRGATITEAVRNLGNTTRSAKAKSFAADLAAAIETVRAETGAASAGAIARELTVRGVPTPSGKAQWQAIQVQRALRQHEQNIS
ncbi:DNA invertase Pin-like site-specific DNA recombinase [Bosea sp. BE271]|uniref:recombinase family protein n=1 Tax=Bosea TaxID=85413 RepID=UPI002862F6BD|nr:MULTISPECIES: recombinase family protein [Bosea]MDR6827201.1 DNA invertase Pin-like site-specific DNA recombinase [Bosea robiniae]MDR6893911.1 DNA invertase Pin-like site-specific DNA recombinase [Bosea sp. BE109]MDR7137306.1 DNA invertase Pin-like site-specific DNA recombinase [Bosea sp. BE168]MDR7174006.1 DNA invertase Pin-like site-specific DNA recombinase [Bosea sp. BE271]